MEDDNWGDAISARLTMSTHNAEHVVLSELQRLEVQNLNEGFASLVRKAVAIDAAANGWALNAFGRPHPTAIEHQVFNDLQREFFDLTYVTLATLAACLNRLPKLVQGVRWNSNERFLGWLQEEHSSPFYNPYIEALSEARRFRTIYTHRGQWKPFDWKTEGSGRYARVVLHGVHPPLPPGATADSTRAGVWSFSSPSTEFVLLAFEAVALRFFGRIPSFYEWDHERCTWEAEGLGSAPAIALENQVRELIERNQPDGAA